LKVGFLGYDFKSKTATVWDDGTHRFPVTNVTDIADALVMLFTNSTAREKARNKAVSIYSIKTSHKEILAAVEKVTGEKWVVKHVDGQQLLAEAKEKLAKGDVNGVTPILLCVSFLDGGWRDWSANAEEGRNALLPNGTETLEETVRRVAQG
jgi:hypothetical protein